MKIIDYLKEEHVKVGELQPGTKEEILAELLQLFSFPSAAMKKRVLGELVEREKVASTAVGRGLAIPHARVEGIDDIWLGVYVTPGGVMFDSLDEKPVKVFFLFVSPHDDVKFHLRFLARLSRVLRNRQLTGRIVDSREPGSVIEAIADFEKDHLG